MKIIVMDSANVRIEVLNVADHMINEDIERLMFLCKQGTHYHKNGKVID